LVCETPVEDSHRDRDARRALVQSAPSSAATTHLGSEPRCRSLLHRIGRCHSRQPPAGGRRGRARPRPQATSRSRCAPPGLPARSPLRLRSPRPHQRRHRQPLLRRQRPRPLPRRRRPPPPDGPLDHLRAMESLGAHVRKSEHGTLAIFWKFTDQHGEGPGPGRCGRGVRPSRRCRRRWCRGRYRPLSDDVVMPNFDAFHTLRTPTPPSPVKSPTGPATPAASPHLRKRFGTTPPQLRSSSPNSAPPSHALVGLDTVARTDHAGDLAHWCQMLRAQRSILWTVAAKAPRAADWLAAYTGAATSGRVSRRSRRSPDSMLTRPTGHAAASRRSRRDDTRRRVARITLRGECRTGPDCGGGAHPYG